MSEDKYPSIFSRQIEATVFFYPSNIFRSTRSFDNWRIYIYMLFAGWDVRMVKNCDRGLENAARGRGHSFSLYGPTLPANNIFIFFSCSKLVLQITNGFVYATLVTESASTPSTNDL